MTISNTENRITPAAGTAAALQVIEFDFPITATSDLKVLKVVTLTGVEETEDETTDYIVTINSGSEGGSIEMQAAVGVLNEIHIIRNTPTTQATDLAAGGDFSAEVIEAALDKLTKLCIEAQDQLNHYLVDLESLEAGVDFQAYSSVLTTLAASTITAFALTVLDDTTAAAARSTLGVFALGDPLCHDGAVLVSVGEIVTWNT